ncbi:unnamed protein product [Urochloa humidicola]
MCAAADAHAAPDATPPPAVGPWTLAIERRSWCRCSRGHGMVRMKVSSDREVCSAPMASCLPTSMPSNYVSHLICSHIIILRQFGTLSTSRLMLEVEATLFHFPRSVREPVAFTSSDARESPLSPPVCCFLRVIRLQGLYFSCGNKAQGKHSKGTDMKKFIFEVQAFPANSSGSFFQLRQ